MCTFEQHYKYHDSPKVWEPCTLMYNHIHYTLLIHIVVQWIHLEIHKLAKVSTSTDQIRLNTRMTQSFLTRMNMLFLPSRCKYSRYHEIYGRNSIIYIHVWSLIKQVKCHYWHQMPHFSLGVKDYDLPVSFVIHWTCEQHGCRFSLTFQTSW